MAEETLRALTLAFGANLFFDLSARGQVSKTEAAEAARRRVGPEHTDNGAHLAGWEVGAKTFNLRLLYINNAGPSVMVIRPWRGE